MDCVLRSKSTSADYPAQGLQDPPQFTVNEKQDSIRMMRINHSGEVCAQALYQGQALMARNLQQFSVLMHAATEENAHLSWCTQRLHELNGRPSWLNPLWFAGSFAIGAAAGVAGDRISLGFLAETEYQVTAHLAKHLSAISVHDIKSRQILQQMREDELQHATNAVAAGGVELPEPIKKLMRFTAKILTVAAGRI